MHPSPLVHLNELPQLENPLLELSSHFDELKLFGNMFKSALRDRIVEILDEIRNGEFPEIETQSHHISLLCTEITAVCSLYRSIQTKVIAAIPNNELKRHFRYIDEFISNTISEYLTLLLHDFEQVELPHADESKKQLRQVILHELLYQKENQLGPKISKEKLFANESILYREGLLNRFVLEALMLKIYRRSLEQKHGNVLGSIAAGIAMFIYMVLFVWKSSDFVIKSFSFVMLVVFFYILKDRLKEFLKQTFYKKATRWLHDYSTEIIGHNGTTIGKLNENFSFIEPEQLPEGFLDIRNYHFNEELQALQRHESIIHYKREITLKQHTSALEERRRELTMIFRLNIHRFILDASDALQPNLKLDPYNQEITERLLPKVYHLNLIIRNSYSQPHSSQKSEIKKYRVVIDKTGIKRVEQIK